MKRGQQIPYLSIPCLTAGRGAIGMSFTQHHTVGQKQYELTDYPGNVPATISDKHQANTYLPVGSGSPSPITTIRSPYIYIV